MLRLSFFLLFMYLLVVGCSPFQQSSFIQITPIIEKISGDAEDTAITGPYILFGQTNFTANLVNQGGVASKSTLNRPYGIDVRGGVLVIADNRNNRVLIKRNLPETYLPNSEQSIEADIVIGQPNGSSTAVNNGGISAATMNNVSSASTDGTRICVADRNNHRVLIWNSIPTVDGQPADLVLGQPDFVSRLPNNGGLSAQSFWTPNDCKVRNGKLYVADDNNQRVLIWNTFPTVNRQPADLVIGQPDFTSNAIFFSQKSVPDPRMLTVTEKYLITGNLLYQQVRIFNIENLNSNYPDALVVLGQPDFLGVSWNAPVSQTHLGQVTGVACDGKRIAVSGYSNGSRVTVWNSIPTVNGQPADHVIGQPDFVAAFSNNGGVSRNSISYDILGLASYGGKLYISDGGNNRITTKSWNSLY